MYVFSYRPKLVKEECINVFLTINLKNPWVKRYHFEGNYCFTILDSFSKQTLVSFFWFRFGWLFLEHSLIPQTVLKLRIEPRVTLKSWSSFFYLPNSGIHMCHHSWLLEHSLTRLSCGLSKGLISKHHPHTQIPNIRGWSVKFLIQNNIVFV